MACGATARRVVEYGRQPVARSLAQARVARNHGVEHHVAEMRLQLLIDLVGKAKSRVVHGEEESLNLQVAVQLRLDNSYGVEQLADAFEGKILSLHWNNHRVGGREGIHGDKAELRAAINQDVIVGVLDLRQQRAQHYLAV